MGRGCRDIIEFSRQLSVVYPRACTLDQHSRLHLAICVKYFDYLIDFLMYKVKRVKHPPYSHFPPRGWYRQGP